MASKKGGCKPLLLFGQEAEKLVSNCNDVPFDISSMFSSDVVDFIELVGKQRSFHPMFMANTLMPIVAHLLSNSKVVVSPTWSEPLLVWSVSIGLKSSGKSPCYQYCMESLQKLESEQAEADRRKYYEHRYDEGENGTENKKRAYNSMQSQMIMNGGTFEGLQDVLKSKEDNDMPASVIYMVDEFTLFFNHIESNANFEDNVLTFYTAKKLTINTRKMGQLKINEPLVQFTGFTQHDTYVRECSRKIDMGGQVERFNIVAPQKVKKCRATEKEFQDCVPVSLYEVFRLIHEMSHGKENSFTLSEEASIENDFIINTRSEEMEDVEEHSSFVIGLCGKATSKRIR